MTKTHINCLICGSGIDITHTGPIEVEQQISVCDLSDAAQYVLLKVPQIARRGKPVLLRDVAELTGYSVSHTQRIMRELAQAGYVTIRPKGTRQHAYLVG